MPVELRVNIWLGLSAVEKKFNSFAEGTFTVFAEMVHFITSVSFLWWWGCFHFSSLVNRFVYLEELLLPQKSQGTLTKGMRRVLLGFLLSAVKHTRVINVLVG